METNTETNTNTTPRINAFLAALTVYLEETYARVDQSAEAIPAALRSPISYSPAKIKAMEAGQRHIQAAQQAERNRDWNTMNAEVQAFIMTFRQIVEVDTPASP
jgi:hypothetical protein